MDQDDHPGPTNFTREALLKKIVGSIKPVVPEKAPQNLRILQQCANVFDDEAVFAATRKEIDIFIANVQSRVSPSTQRKRALAELRWRRMLQAYAPGLPENEMWSEKTVLAHYQFMLPILVYTSIGTRGRKFLKAKTLDEKTMHFTWAIAKNTRNENGDAVGTALLSKGGILSRLQDQQLTLVNQFQLERRQDTKVYYGKPELKILIEEALKNTENSGRIVGLQRICLILVAFFTGLRPSSLGPCEKAYLAQEKYPKLSDIKIFRLGYMTFRIDLVINNFKGYNNTMEAQSRIFPLDPVKNWFNVPFDVALYFVGLMFARNALKGITTLEDLRKCELHSIPIRDDMLDQPLFLHGRPGGRSFLLPPTPMKSPAITAMMSALGTNAGLSGATTYAFRRGAANEYEITLGKELTEQILTHTSSGALHFYSKNTANIDLVAMRMHEMPDPLTANQQYLLERRQNMDNARMAVHLLIHSKDAPVPNNTNEDADEQESIKLPARNIKTYMPQLSHEKQLDIIQSDAELGKLVMAETSAWSDFLLCFSEPSNREPYDRILQNINHIKKNPTMEKGTSEVAEAHLRAAAKAAAARKTKIIRAATKEFRRLDHTQRDQMTKNATTEQLNEARNKLKKPSNCLVAEPLGQPSRLTINPLATGTATGTSVIATAANATRYAENHTAPSCDIDPALAGIYQFINSAEVRKLAGKLQEKIQTTYDPLADDDGDDDDDDDDDEEVNVDSEARQLYNNIANLVPRDKKSISSRIASQTDFDNVENITNTEEDVQADCVIQTAHVRDAFLEDILLPMITEKFFADLPKEPNGGWRCPRCVSYFPDKPSIVFIRVNALQRHINTQHTEWKELVLKMVPIPGDPAIQGYRCPTVACAFESSTEDDVRTHCLEDCKDKGAYVRMYDQDQACRIDSHKSKDPGRPSNHTLMSSLEKKNQLINKIVALRMDPCIGLAEIDPVLYAEIRSDWTKVAEMYASNEESPFKAKSTTSDSFDELNRKLKLEFEMIWPEMVAEYKSEYESKL